MSTVASDLLIRTYAKRLKLPALAASANRLAAEAAAAGHGPLEFLAALLGAEVAQREANVERARIRAARFPELKELAEPSARPPRSPGRFTPRVLLGRVIELTRMRLPHTFVRPQRPVA